MARNEPKIDKNALAEQIAIGATNAEAAKACGCSESTVKRHLGTSEFRSLVRRIRWAILGRSIGRKARQLEGADKVIDQTTRVKGGKTPIGVLRLNLEAARLIQEQFLKGMALTDAVEDLQEDLQAIKEALEANGIKVESQKPAE